MIPEKQIGLAESQAYPRHGTMHTSRPLIRLYTSFPLASFLLGDDVIEMECMVADWRQSSLFVHASQEWVSLECASRLTCATSINDTAFCRDLSTAGILGNPKTSILFSTRIWLTGTRVL